MDAWSFHSQVFFLTHRLRSHYQLAQHLTRWYRTEVCTKMPRSLPRNLFVQGHIQQRDYQTYRDLYETMMRFLPPPDLVIYLRASVPTLLKSHLQPRTRLRAHHRARLSAWPQRPLRRMDRQLHALPGAGRPRRRPRLRVPPRSLELDPRKGAGQVDRQGGGRLRAGGSGACSGGLTYRAVAKRPPLFLSYVA